MIKKQLKTMLFNAYNLIVLKKNSIFLCIFFFIPFLNHDNAMAMQQKPTVVNQRIMLSTKNIVKPYFFEEKIGNDFNFFASGNGYNVELDSEKVTFTSNSVIKSRESNENVLFTMYFSGSRYENMVEGIEAVTFPVHKYVGNNPAAWKLNSPVFNKVKYSNSQLGADIIFVWEDGQLRFDVNLDSGADPSAIAFSFSEILSKPEVDSSGNLVLNTRQGQMRIRKPFAFQHTAEGYLHVDCEYKIMGVGADGTFQIGFAIEDYDLTAGLVIDPVVEEIFPFTHNGGPTEGHGVAVDSTGNIYVTGNTFGPGINDVFFYKLDPTGEPLFLQVFGGNQNDLAQGIAVDAEGNAVITGITGSLDFPVLNPYSPEAGQLGVWTNGFVSKFSPEGVPIFSFYLGGNALRTINHPTGEVDLGKDIAVDPMGNIYVTGFAATEDFPVTENAFDGTLDGLRDCFLAKMDPSGFPIYVTLIGGENEDVCMAVDTDALGNAYITGITHSQNFPTTEGAQSRTLNGLRDLFFSKFDSTGQLSYSTYIGGSQMDSGYGISVDENGTIYIGGTTDSIDFPVTSELSTSTSSNRIFLYVLDGETNMMQASILVSGSGNDAVFDIAVDSQGMVYLAGGTDSPDFPCEFTSPPMPGANRAYAMKLDPTQGTKRYCTQVGLGRAFDMAYSIDTDPYDDAYVTGHTVGEDLIYWGSFLTKIHE